MKDGFKPVSEFEIMRMSNEEMIDYYRDLREYVYLKGEKIKGIKFRQTIKPLLVKALRLQRIFTGRKLELLDDKSHTENKRPIIYAVSHIGRYDLEIVCEATSKQAHILCGDPETMYRNFDGFAADLNGTVYVDTNSKSDRHVAKETAVRVLEQGGNILMYPEGIWNLDPCRPILPLYPGIIEMAYRTNATIIPIGMEQYGDEFIVNIGKNFEVSDYIPEGDYTKENESKAKDALRDEMATLKYEVWESTGKGDRRDFDSDYYERFVDQKLSEWPVYNRDIIEARTYREKGVTSANEVYQFTKKLIPKKENAFLIRKD